MGYDVSSALHAARLTGRDVNRLIAPEISVYQERNQAVAPVLAALEQSGQASLVQPELLLCDDALCQVSDGQYPWYRDDDHLSTRGAEKMAPLFEPVFSRRETEE